MPLASTILVPTDLSPASHAALEEAARWAALGAARIVLLHVFDVSPFHVLPDGVTLSASTLRRIAEEANGAAHSVLSSLRTRFFSDASAVDVRTVEFDGAARGICETAKLLTVDLIVIGTRGRTAGSHRSLGSVVENVVRAAPCRVLVVPRVEAERHTH